MESPKVAKRKNDNSLHYIKYMGSKSKIIDFVLNEIRASHNGGPICDLFAGSCTLAGYLRDDFDFISNDIQAYSSVLGKAFLIDYNNGKLPTSEDVIMNATHYYKSNYEALVGKYSYEKVNDLFSFVETENKNRTLIDKKLYADYHLFSKYYSGTWWTAEQCFWIDSLRKSIEDYKDTPTYNSLLCSLMYSMAYCSQGTGHFAQYREAKDEKSMSDIMIYRKRSINSYFTKKYQEAIQWMPNHPPKKNHIILTEDYTDCLKRKELHGATIYADPPYCFVHYSRFYHALETIVRYDYPEIQHIGGEMVKGRYRDDRHQSPFCIRSQVRDAFSKMFSLSSENKCNLVLSYSNTGMITLDEIIELAEICSPGYFIGIQTMDHTHMTMGRKDDRSRDVKEALVSIKR